MSSVDSVISKFKRDLTLVLLLRAAMIVGMLLAVCAGPVFGFKGDGTLLIMIMMGAWFALTIQSLRGSRLSVDSPALIAAGDYDRAEQNIDDSLKRFSIFRSAKLMSLQHLALLRHAQQRWRESALLCQALLRQKLNRLDGLEKSTQLLLADSMLQLGDLNGVYNAMQSLQRDRLPLPESLTLQLLQLDYGSRVLAWDAMLDSVGLKVQLSELMSTLNAARSQSFLALAAFRKGRIQLARWLRGRAELLADPAEIAKDRPILGEMFKQVW